MTSPAKTKSDDKLAQSNVTTLRNAMFLNKSDMFLLKQK